MFAIHCWLLVIITTVFTPHGSSIALCIVEFSIQNTKDGCRSLSSGGSFQAGSWIFCILFTGQILHRAILFYDCYLTSFQHDNIFSNCLTSVSYFFTFPFSLRPCHFFPAASLIFKGIWRFEFISVRLPFHHRIMGSMWLEN